MEFLFYLGIAAIAVTIWATCIERFWFAIRRSELKVLPKGSPEIVVLHISDIHMAPWQTYKQRWIRSLQAKTNPDLIINTGDNLGHARGIKPVLEALNPLTGVPGVFVNGSNDLYAPSKRNPLQYLFHPSNRHRENEPSIKLDTDSLITGFSSFGWENLNNTAKTMNVNGVRINFFGTDDAHELRDDFAKAHEALNKLGKADLLIGVTHAPYLRVLEDLGEADVVFAGHTHGGQVCWPFWGRALVTNCDLPTKFARGLHQVPLKTKNPWLNVSAGLGHSIYAPVRLACRPEVRVVTLKPKD